MSPADASPARGLILIEASQVCAPMVLGITEVLAGSGLLLVWPEGISPYRGHGLVASRIRCRKHQITIRLPGCSQDIVPADRTAVAQWAAGRVAAWRLRLLAAGLPPHAPLICCTSPEPSALDGTLSQAAASLNRLAACETLPGETECMRRSGLTCHAWRSALRQLADLGMVMQDARGHWRRWRGFPLRETRLPISASFGAQQYIAMFTAAMDDVAVTSIQQRPDAEHWNLTASIDNSVRIILRNEMRPEDGDAIAFDYDPVAAQLLTSLAAQDCRHLILVSPQQPPLLAEASITLRRMVEQAGLECFEIPMATNVFDRSLRHEELGRLRQWAAAGFRVGLCSISQALSLGLLGPCSVCGLELGRNLLVCLPHDHAAQYGRDAVSMPSHSFTYAGQVAAWMLHERQWSRPAGPRQVRLAPTDTAPDQNH